MINRGLLPVSAEYRDVVDRGLKHDDDGGDMDFGTFDIVPEPAAIAGDVREQGDTASDVNQELSDFATMELAAQTSISDVQAMLAVLLRKCESPADETMVRGLAAQREEAIRAAKKK